MKKLFSLGILCLLLIGVSAQNKANHFIKGHIEGLVDADIYLANYYGNKLYYNDTARVDSKGNYFFNGKPFEECGRYALVMPGPKYFEFIVADEDIIMNCTPDADISKVEIIRSENNKVYFNYIKFLKDKFQLRAPLDACLADSLKSEAEKTTCREQLEKLNREVVNYQNAIIADYPNLLFTKFLRMSQELVLPELPQNLSDEEKQKQNYRWMIDHYWDRVDLTDPRIVREPAFHKLAEDFLTKYVYQIPDTVCKEVKRVVDLTQGNSETFKYLVHLATYTGETSKIMCMDELFVYMIDNYYAKGLCPWMKADKLKDMIEAADKKRDCLCGEIAEEILLPNEKGSWTSLYKNHGEYTLVVIWESTCGHCKKEIPLLLDLYHKYKNKGFVVYAIGNELENDKWESFIQEKNLDWINVSDGADWFKNDGAIAKDLIQTGKTTVKSVNFRTTWDVTSTPKVYLMDKDLKIIAKSLGAEQLDQLLEQLYKGGTVKSDQLKETDYDDEPTGPKRK